MWHKSILFTKHHWSHRQRYQDLSLLNCRCSTGTRNIMGTGRTVLSNTNDCQYMSITRWPAWSSEWKMGVEAFWISLGCPGGLPGCIHLQNTQGMGHPFHPWPPPNPPLERCYLINSIMAVHTKRDLNTAGASFRIWGVWVGLRLGAAKISAEKVDLNDSTKGQSFALGFTYLPGNKKCKQHSVCR